MRFYKIVAAALVACLLFALGACGSETSLAGVYAINDITDDPDGMTFVEMESMYKEMGLDIQDFIRFEFTKDGLFTLTIFGDVENGSYTMSGKALTLAFDGGTSSSAEISGKKITWTYGSGAKLVFTKK